MSRVETAVLLCAGRGSRLRPYTDTVPKPLLPVDGKPTLEWVLESLHSAGVKKLVLVTHHLAEQIEEYMQVRSGPLFESWCCAEQLQLAGTADATLVALSAKPDWFKHTFIVSATDYIIWPEFYPALVDFHEQHNADVTVSLKKIPQDELAMRSSVRFDSDENIVEVVEKPEPGTAPSQLSANLVFLMPAEIVPFMHAVEPSLRGEKEIQSAINQFLSEGGSARGLLQKTPNEWVPS